MQYLMHDLLVSSDITYLIVKISVLLLVLLIWMLVRAHPSY